MMIIILIIILNIFNSEKYCIMHTTLKFLKSKNNLTLQKEIKIDIINNKSSKFYKITNSMLQKY